MTGQSRATVLGTKSISRLLVTFTEGSVEAGRPRPTLSIAERAFYEGLHLTTTNKLGVSANGRRLSLEPVLTQRSPLTGRALDVLLTDINHVRTTRALAKRLKCHHVYLAREFSRAIQFPPSQYARMVRLGAAMGFVVASDVPLSRIASLVGFGSKATFNRVVKSVTGRSPRFWRSAWRYTQTAA